MESNQPIYKAPKIPKLNKKILSSSVLSGAPKLKVTRIGMPISKIKVGKNDPKVVVGQSPVAPESLLSIANAIDTIAGGLKRVTEMFVQEGEVEKKESIQRKKRERIEEENKKRKVKESGLEKGIANFLLSPVKAVAGKAQGILSSLMEFFTLLFVGWLTDKGLLAIKLNSEGNVKGLEQLRDSVLKNLAIVGGTLVALNTGFFGLAGLIGGIAGGILGWLASNTIGKLFNRLRGVRPPVPSPSPSPSGGGPGGIPPSGAFPTSQIGQQVPVRGPDGKLLLGANGKPITSPVVHLEPRTGMVNGVRTNLSPRAITAYEIANNPKATASQIESLMRYELKQSGYVSNRLSAAQLRSQLRMKYGMKNNVNLATRTLELPRGPWRPTLQGFDDLVSSRGRTGSGFGSAEGIIQRAPSIPDPSKIKPSGAKSLVSLVGTGKPNILNSLTSGRRGGLVSVAMILGEYFKAPIQDKIAELYGNMGFGIRKQSDAQIFKEIENLKKEINLNGGLESRTSEFVVNDLQMYLREAMRRGLIDVNGNIIKKKPQFAGPGGDPSGSGRGQAQQNPLNPEQRQQMRAPASISPIQTLPFIPQQEPELEPNIIYRKSGGGQQNQNQPLKSGSATDVPLIASSNPDNFYTLYSQVNYNVVM